MKSVRDKVYNQLWLQVGDQARNQVWNQVWLQVREEIRK